MKVFWSSIPNFEIALLFSRIYEHKSYMHIEGEPAWPPLARKRCYPPPHQLPSYLPIKLLYPNVMWGEVSWDNAAWFFGGVSQWEVAKRMELGASNWLYEVYLAMVQKGLMAGLDHCARWGWWRWPWLGSPFGGIPLKGLEVAGYACWCWLDSICASSEGLSGYTGQLRSFQYSFRGLSF